MMGAEKRMPLREKIIRAVSVDGYAVHILSALMIGSSFVIRNKHETTGITKYILLRSNNYKLSQNKERI